MLTILRRLTPVLLALVAIFSLMMSGAILIGHARSFPQRVERLHLADCVPPCWNGITLRTSSPDEVKDRISASFPDYQRSQAVDNSKYLTWAQFDNYARISNGIAITFANGHVSAIDIGTDYFSAQTPSLGETVAVFGLPTCVMIDERTQYSNLYYEYPADHFLVQLSVLQPALSTPVALIGFSIPDDAICKNVYAKSWYQFRRSKRLYFVAS